MNITHTCIITDDVQRLRDFYRTVLGIEAKEFTEHYVEFPIEHVTLSLYSLMEHEKLAPGSAMAASNKSIMLEFEVDDVDTQYDRLKDIAVEWVMSPTTFPWGNRSIYFRDPDGNLLNFYTRVSTG
jgi:catechol 2,3-dioxygenase-like lactoylglutathione lyase family enzyme